MAIETARLDSRAFGLACGLCWAGGVFALGIMARFGWGRRWERLLADVYRGYNETSSGLVVGALWAFTDGLSGGYVLAWLYNRLHERTQRAEPGAGRPRQTVRTSTDGGRR